MSPLMGGLCIYWALVSSGKMWIFIMERKRKWGVRWGLGVSLWRTGPHCPAAHAQQRDQTDCKPGAMEQAKVWQCEASEHAAQAAGCLLFFLLILSSHVSNWKWHFSASLADTDGQVTNFCPMECRQKLLDGASEKDIFPGRAELAGRQLCPSLCSFSLSGIRCDCWNCSSHFVTMW